MRFNKVRAFLIFFVLQGTIGSAFGQDYVEIGIELQRDDFVVLYTIPEGSKGFSEKNAIYKRVPGGQYRIIRWELGDRIKNYRIDLSNNEINSIQLKYIKYSISGITRKFQGNQIFEEFFPSSFLSVVEADSQSVSFEVNELQDFFDPILYRSMQIGEYSYQDTVLLSLKARMESNAVMRITVEDSVTQTSSSKAYYLDEGSNDIDFLFTGVETPGNIIINSSLGKSNTTELLSMSVSWKRGQLDLGPFEIIRNSEIRDYEEVTVDNKRIILKNILDRKWETSALIFTVPQPDQERQWWILALIGFVVPALWMLNSRVIIRNWRSFD